MLNPLRNHESLYLSSEGRPFGRDIRFLQILDGSWWIHMSHKKNPPIFHYTSCLLGILTMAYYNPYVAG